MWYLVVSGIIVLFFAFVWFDKTFSQGIIYRVEVLKDLEQVDQHLNAIQELDQRYAQEPWWEWDPQPDRRYKTWLKNAYQWAKTPWWRRIFIEPPAY